MDKTDETTGDAAAGWWLVRVRGIVQGVGFRPAVWRIARAMGLAGSVRNDGDGVSIRVAASRAEVAAFIARLRAEAPPLARIASVELAACPPETVTDDSAFRILGSGGGPVRTGVAPDAATCPACRAEVLDPGQRRHLYPFTNCTHCGPRLTIVERVPYDRANTTMAPFPLCPDCAREYGDPADRRFHAQPIACPVCGPRLWLEDLEGGGAALSGTAALDAAVARIRRGGIVAVKALGGFHLACDATDAVAVARLRARKRRDRKPFAVMARDAAMARRFADVDAAAAALLSGPEAPIVLLPADGPERLPEAVAPGLEQLGFMLPATPLHVLLMERVAGPLVMTSGNLSDEPPCIDDADARQRLSGIADAVLGHDRRIATRVDDSVARIVGGRPRLLRRARGYAPAPLRLPPGFGAAPPVLALGGELKATVALTVNGEAVLSQHLGDLEDAATFGEYRRTLDLYAGLFDHAPTVIAVDRHPDYLSARLGRARGAADGLPVVEVQHHHAHVASCLAENGWPLDGGPVLGLALDGLGYGDDGALWGGEFLVADYRGYRRVASLIPVPLIGGAQAVREPWRNTHAHLMAAFGWPRLVERYAGLELVGFLAAKPRAVLDGMVRAGLNAPPASSCGRLFDAVGAALGLARDRAAYEGEAAVLLEAAVDAASLDDGGRYPFAVHEGDPLRLDPAPMWAALLADLAAAVPAGVIAARFHSGLAEALAALAARVAGEWRLGTVALSGGCLHNAVLLERLTARLSERRLAVLTQADVPSGDGGLALGQAVVAGALRMVGPASGR